MLIGAVIGTVAYLVLALVSLADPTRQQLPLILAAMMCAVGALLAHQGRVFQGGLVGLFGVCCEVNYGILTATQFPSPSLLATAPVVVAATLLLQPRHATILTVSALVVTWPVVLLSPPIQASGVTPSVIYWLVAHAVITSAVWGLVTIELSILDRAFVEVVRKERELSETISSAPDGILVVDANDLVQIANPAAIRLLGLPLAECIGRRICAVLTAADARGDVATGFDIHDTGERPLAWSLHRIDGTTVELEVTWRTMDSGRRQLVLRDLSERISAEQTRREMELQLAHSQRLEAVGQLAGGIAHDFNNILTIVGTSAEVLRAELRDERASPLLDEILAAQERGATLTRQLLAFARREVVHPRVFDLSAQVLSLRRLLQRVAGEQARISCDVEPDCRIRADVGQLEQTLVNLVSNARDAMPNGGTCTLTVVRMTNDDGETWVRLRVRDEGVGMDAATQARAFEPFFTTKPRGRGTGLGLAAVHGMAMQSGGRADIESSPSRGTSVILEFPFANAPSAILAVQPAAAFAGGGATILVAEDDDGTRATVARILQRLGYTVLLAPDGLQALRMAEANAGQVDLLVTDVMMPGLSGPKLAARLHQQMPGLPVLFMSGYPEDALEEVRGLNIETDFLAKPFTSAAMARRVALKLGVALSVTPPDAPPAT